MISEDRTKHILQVARLMKQLAIKHNLPEDRVQEIFVLGLLHDIGYEFVDTPDHNKVGGNLLKTQGYKFWQEVYYHGNPNSPYQSIELDLLNWADMHTDGKGNLCTSDERLAEIAARRGMKSDAYLQSRKMIQSLKSKGWE